jgi:hypothetical protein
MLENSLNSIARGVQQNRAKLESGVISDAEPPIWKNATSGIRQIAIYYAK